MMMNKNPVMLHNIYHNFETFRELSKQNCLAQQTVGVKDERDFKYMYV